MARAVDHELERVALARYLDDVDDTDGTTPDELIELFDALWPS